jgi:hypothetical protein
MIPGIMTFRSSMKVYWTNHCVTFITDVKGPKSDTKLCYFPKVYRWLRTARNWSLAFILPVQQVYHYCSATLLVKKVINFQRIFNFLSAVWLLMTYKCLYTYHVIYSILNHFNNVRSINDNIIITIKMTTNNNVRTVLLMNENYQFLWHCFIRRNVCG